MRQKVLSPNGPNSCPWHSLQANHFNLRTQTQDLVYHKLCTKIEYNAGIRPSMSCQQTYVSQRAAQIKTASQQGAESKRRKTWQAEHQHASAFSRDTFDRLRALLEKCTYNSFG